MDSVTRYAMALREAALAAGEPPATKGYPPSVFAALPRLLERAGTSDGRGAITALYTVLVEGDDLPTRSPTRCAASSDGHIVLSRGLAEKGHFPAIDVLKSISRLAPEIAGDTRRGRPRARHALHLPRRAGSDPGRRLRGRQRSARRRRVAAQPHIDNFLKSSAPTSAPVTKRRRHGS